MKIALVGGSGFIGTALSRLLARSEVQQTSFDLVSPSLPTVAWTRCDIRDEGLNGTRFDSYDAVVHLAGLLGRLCGENPEDGWRSNVEGTRNLLATVMRAPSVRRLVFLSTSMVYAQACHAVDSSAARACGQCVYRESKLRGEAMMAEAAASGLDVTILRPFSVYGPGPAEGRRGHFIASWLERAEAGLPLPLYGTGEQEVDLLHVDDLAHLLLAALTTPAPSVGAARTADAGTGVPISVARVASWFIRAKPALQIERHAGRTIAARSPADVQAARHLFGWEATILPNEGITALLRERLAGTE